MTNVISLPARKERGRYTYIHGSRPEGVVLYDEHPNGGSLKCQSWHDTDPAGGVQCNAFDLVRLHLFSQLDSEEDKAKPVNERPSYHAMCQLALQQPELRQASADSDYALIRALGPLTEPAIVQQPVRKRLRKSLVDLQREPTKVEWLLEDQLERATNVIFVGHRGSMKSFVLMDWAMRVAVEQRLPVLVISAEGRDADRRVDAWLRTHAPNVSREDVPFWIIERRMDLTDNEQLELIRQECADITQECGKKIALICFDTFSKLSGALDENSNSDVKAFLSRIDALAREFGAATITVFHSGHNAQGRARGASAIGADTDAEHLFTRDNVTKTVSVSRDRFKNSPELPPLVYRWKVVDLGRKDSRDRPVTSLAVELLEGSAAHDAKILRSRRLPKEGTPMRLVLDAAREEQSMTFYDGDLFARVEAALSGDKPRRQFERAVTALIKARWLYQHGDRLSLHPQLPIEEADASEPEED